MWTVWCKEAAWENRSSAGSDDGGAEDVPERAGGKVGISNVNLSQPKQQSDGHPPAALAAICRAPDGGILKYQEEG